MRTVHCRGPSVSLRPVVADTYFANDGAVKSTRFCFQSGYLSTVTKRSVDNFLKVVHVFLGTLVLNFIVDVSQLVVMDHPFVIRVLKILASVCTRLVKFFMMMAPAP